MTNLVERLHELAAIHSPMFPRTSLLVREAAARIEALEKALGLALAWLVPSEPGDSRAVSSEFVAMASIHANLSNDECIKIIDQALSLRPQPASQSSQSSVPNAADRDAAIRFWNDDWSDDANSWRNLNSDEQDAIVQAFARHRIQALSTRPSMDGLEKLIERVRERYTPEPVPPCRVCGGPLSIQRVGGGEATVWGCSPQEDDPDNPGHLRLKSDYGNTSDHYGRSRWTQLRSGDRDVLKLIEAIASLPLRSDVEGECELCVGKCRGHRLGHPEEWEPEPGSRAYQAPVSRTYRDGVEDAARVADAWIAGSQLRRATAKCIAAAIRSLSSLPPSPMPGREEIARIMSETLEIRQFEDAEGIGFEIDPDSESTAADSILSLFNRAPK